MKTLNKGIHLLFPAHYELQEFNPLWNINYQSHLSQECHDTNHVDVCCTTFKTLDSFKVWHFNISSFFVTHMCVIMWGTKADEYPFLSLKKGQLSCHAVKRHEWPEIFRHYMALSKFDSALQDSAAECYLSAIRIKILGYRKVKMDVF